MMRLAFPCQWFVNLFKLVIVKKGFHYVVWVSGVAKLFIITDCGEGEGGTLLINTTRGPDDGGQSKTWVGGAGGYGSVRCHGGTGGDDGSR